MELQAISKVGWIANGDFTWEGNKFSHDKDLILHEKVPIGKTHRDEINVSIYINNQGSTKGGMPRILWKMYSS